MGRTLIWKAYCYLLILTVSARHQVSPIWFIPIYCLVQNSRSLGATDDGMGVATLIQLAEYFVKHQPRRRVVFNINDAEEDYLHGARVSVLFLP